MTDPDALAKLDLFQIIREGKIGLVAANLALAAYQRRLAAQLGVEPGAELKAAAVGAKERGLPPRSSRSKNRPSWKASRCWCSTTRATA